MQIKFAGTFNYNGERTTTHVEADSNGIRHPYTKIVSIPYVLRENNNLKSRFGRIKVNVRYIGGEEKDYYFSDVVLLMSRNNLADANTGETISSVFADKKAIIRFTLYDVNATIEEQQELMSLVLQGVFQAK